MGLFKLLPTSLSGKIVRAQSTVCHVCSASPHSIYCFTVSPMFQGTTIPSMHVGKGFCKLESAKRNRSYEVHLPPLKDSYFVNLSLDFYFVGCLSDAATVCSVQ